MKDIYPQAVSTGNLGWWDIFRPFTEALLRQKNGEKTSNLPVARIPLTNTFYRQPQIDTKFQHDTSILKATKHPFLEGNILQTKLLPDSLRENAWSICLPGPYTFSRAANIDTKSPTSYKSENEMMYDFTEILKEEIKVLTAEGFSHIILDEGGLVWESLDNEIIEAIEENWTNLGEAVSPRLAVHTYYSLEPHLLELLANTKVWGIGIDCVRNKVASLADYDFDSKVLIAGVVDAQAYFRSPSGNLVVEEIKDLVETGEMLAETTADQIILAPTSRLEFIPRSVADLKIQALGHTIKRLEEQV